MRSIATAHLWSRAAPSSASLAPPLPPPSCVIFCVRRCVHTGHRLDAPPPLVTASVRRRHAAKSWHAPVPHPHASSVSADVRVAASWTDLLAHGEADSSGGSRVALREAAALCLAREAPRRYAVYRPSSPVSDAEGHHPSAAQALATPQDFLLLLQQLRQAPGTFTEARRIAEVLLDLLQKPPHPRQPGPWDLTQREVRAVKAAAIQHAMDIAADGDEALAWLTRLLRLAETSAAAAAEPPRVDVLLLWTALSERYGLHGGSAAHRVHLGDPDGEWLLTGSSVVLAAVAAAMLRSATEGMKAHALELLEAAALARLSSTLSSSSSFSAARAAEGAVAVGFPGGGALAGAPRTLFDEAVAVHCAEAAAVRGDAETVTRLIFLLYRARGALAFATLDEHRQHRRSGRSGAGEPRCVREGDARRRAPAWFSASWWRSGGAAVAAQTAASLEDDAGDARFEQAVVRLLRGAMHAVLYNPGRASDPVSATVHEALALWDGLRGATSWPGLAAVGIELLRFLADERARRPVAAGGGCAVDDACIEPAALRVHEHLCRAAPAQRRTAAQRDVLNHATTLLLRILSVDLAITASGQDVAVPVTSSTVAAEQTLRLFSHLSGPDAVEAALPYALAASLAVFAATATQKQYRVAPALLAPLAACFSETRSLRHYCVGSASADAPVHVAVSGGLLLLHVLLLSSVPLGEWARDDGGLWPMLQRLQIAGDWEPGTAAAVAVPTATAAAHPVAAWLGVAGAQQRALLWSLLCRAKRREGPWCGAVLTVFSSPASSTAITSAVGAAYPTAPHAELRDMTALLYVCGNSGDPLNASRTLDGVVSALVQLPIRTLALESVGAEVRRLVARRQPVSVLVLGVATLRALVTRGSGASSGERGEEPGIESHLHVLRPLLVGSAAAPLSSSPVTVIVVLTPDSLVELRRLYAEASGTSRRVSALVRDLHDSLAGTLPSSTLHTHVAASWPILPCLAAAFQEQQELQFADGVREATAAARHVELTLPKESRPVVSLWTEEELPLNSPHAVAAKADVLRRYGVREVSEHHAHVEKAKRDIFALVRSSDVAGSVRHASARVSGSASLADATAARRTRHSSLLDAVSSRNRRQRSV
ncbi:hypothetical protein NESM_000555500 [Novymonas esmeraldas]|uniref:Uncharacterized protein n=1 Tax=Novymonas esmeraldas TaxID=1808958 RepID=A0AAW0EQ30_9TRYP